MGWAWTFGLNGLLGATAYLGARHGLRQPRGLTRWLAAATLGWGWLTVGMQLLGSLGFLSRLPLLAWVALGMAPILFARRIRGRFDDPPAGPRPGSGWGWEGVGAIGLTLWVSAVLFAPSFVLPVKVVSDGPIYHLLFAIRWWKSGRLELVPTPFGENAAPYFPATGDLWFCWLVIGWGGDLLARVGQVPFLLLAGLSAYALARRLGTSERAGVVATCWFLACTPLLVFTFEPNVDTLFIAGYLAGVYFLVRYALGDDGRASLLLAGLALGCSMGTKAVGIVFLPPVLAVGLVAVLSRESAARRRWAAIATLGLSTLLVAGYWYGRNAWLTGNPLYPLHLAAFGRVWLAGWYGPEVMPLSQYYLPAREWRALVDTLMAVADARMAPFWGLALLGAWRWGRDSGDASVDRWVWGLSALAVLNVGLFWLAIPYRTQQRFMLQALGLAAVPLGRLLDRSRWWTVAGVLLLAIHLMTDQGWLVSEPGREPPWDLTPIVPNSYSGLLKVPHDPATIAAMLADPAARLGLLGAFGLGALAFASAWGWSRLRTPIRAVPLGAAVLGTTALFGLHAAAAFPWEGDARARHYARFPDYYRGWIETDRLTGPSGVAIAYAGHNLPYYLFGPDLQNEVRYVNINRHRGWLLHDYHWAASEAAGRPATWDRPRPGWDRVEADYGAWLGNLRADRIGWLVVTRANPVEGPHYIADEEGFPIERVWADAHPESFRLLYGSPQGDPLYRLYRVLPAAP